MSLVETFLPYMHDVGSCELSLRELNLMWRLIESSIKMNHADTADVILPTLARTREHFDGLEAELVASLVQQKLTTVLREIGSHAQYVIDIVVRNLYERTADVGFLATDPELCAFVAGGPAAPGDIAARLRAYRSKYTVYDEILLLDPQGTVLAQAGEQAPVARSRDPLVAQALAGDRYVEVFRASDLQPHKQRALVYARRMLHPESGAAVGVLCLCFNFEQEMEGIFRSHRQDSARYNMLLLDGENRCIASADAAWVPVGAMVPVNRTDDAHIVLYGGRPYLVRTFAAQGYQGYPGPKGWQGQVMVPLELAFRRTATERHAQLDPVLRRGLLAHAGNFCPPLQQILTAADTIRRVVWNGQVMTAGGREDSRRLRPVLEQISETGSRSNALFASSIRQLYATVLSASLQDSEFVSHLLVDLLDRNLYERADDCRWWALNPVLRRGLAQSVRAPADVAAMRDVLEYINGLYTVYTRIFVYDGDGALVTQSVRDGDDDFAETRVASPDILRQVMALSSDQGYVVSPFEASPLYGGTPTYVFHAAIRCEHDPARIVGGIGLVFDSGRELRAMLADGLAGKANADAFFVDRQGCILATTHPERAVGSVLEIAPELLALAGGRSASQLAVQDGEYAIVGSTASNGYREFKVSDGYREDVLAIVCERFGPVLENVRVTRAEQAWSVATRAADAQEFATFYSGGALFALETAGVREARRAAEITPVRIGSPPRSVGLLRVPGPNGREQTIWVFDLGALLTGRPSAVTPGSQVVVVVHEGHEIGLLAEELHAVASFGAGQLSATPLAAAHRLVRGFIRGPGDLGLIQLLDLPLLFRVFGEGEADEEGEREPALAAS